MVWIGMRAFSHRDEANVSFEERTTLRGPIAEYDARVEAGKIRNDEHQRGHIHQSPPAPLLTIG